MFYNFFMAIVAGREIHITMMSWASVGGGLTDRRYLIYLVLFCLVLGEVF
jgi:hypothetical protein